MGERELIDYVRELSAGEAQEWLTVGIGDDAACLVCPPEGELVATVDSVIEGVHYPAGTTLDLVGRKAIARALSDIAAMAARPVCSLAAVMFASGTSEDRCRELVRSLFRTAQQMSAPIIGGDVASGADRLSIAITALGAVQPGQTLTRSGARPGDAVCVTGTLGGAILGRHLQFDPRVEEAGKLAAGWDVHALIDISDGLSTDALHLAEAGGRGLVLRAADVPISDAARDRSGRTGREPLWHALNDGEDYELLFCLPDDAARHLAASGLCGLPVTVIGRVREDASSWLEREDGSLEQLRAGGWEHLSQ